jgi:Ras-related GTP-binding protein C/D
VRTASASSDLANLRAGKSSCIKTVFQHLPVKDVPYIGITQKIEKVDYE